MKAAPKKDSILWSIPCRANKPRWLYQVRKNVTDSFVLLFQTWKGMKLTIQKQKKAAEMAHWVKAMATVWTQVWFTPPTWRLLSIYNFSCGGSGACFRCLQRHQIHIDTYMKQNTHIHKIKVTDTKIEEEMRGGEKQRKNSYSFSTGIFKPNVGLSWVREA